MSRFNYDFLAYWYCCLYCRSSLYILGPSKLGDVGADEATPVVTVAEIRFGTHCQPVPNPTPRRNDASIVITEHDDQIVFSHPFPIEQYYDNDGPEGRRR